VERSALQALVDRLPRVKLTDLPTPLDEVPRFARAIAGPNAPRLFVKRDDLTQIVGGGNKARVLEFFLGEARARGCDVLIAGGGGAHSNHARACGAAARRLGMTPVMVLRAGGERDTPQGNLLLDKLLGIELHFIAPEQVADAGRFGLVPFMEEIAEDYRRRGRNPYLIRGSPYPPGPVGYVNAALELLGQLESVGAAADWIFAPSTGSTQAGLLLAVEALGLSWRVVGVSPGAIADEAARSQVATVAGWTAAHLGLTTGIVAEGIRSFGRRYGTDRSGRPTEAGLEALRTLAETEGIVIDPAYNAQAMAGLVDQIRTGAIRPGETAVYVNTGGFPEVFTHNAELAAFVDRGAMAVPRG
jgi:1-aminocyclopropane-1-carboxylate deaminase/D-cysteine desulfhydrase-like pyridoxal-dependent ACC family enzyme